MKLYNSVKSKKGSSMVMFAISLVVIMVCASISVDVGMIVYEKAEIANATDSAALAGGQELADNVDNADDVARAYLQKNGVDPNSAEILVSADGKSITIDSKKTVDYYFAKVLGYDRGEVKARAVVKTMPVTSVNTGIRPFAIEQQTLNFGETYILKDGAGNGSSGNYGALALGGSGASNFKFNIINGYSGSLKVGDSVNTETGNMNQSTQYGVDELIRGCTHSPRCTFDSFQDDCSRVITVIIVDSLDVNGGKPVKVVGFASFFLEAVQDRGGHTEIQGRFVKTTTSGDMSESQIDYGLQGTKLME